MHRLKTMALATLLALFVGLPAQAAEHFPWLGIPYRNDGAVNDQGDFSRFESPETVEPSPGLNCSGLVVQIARTLSAAPIPLNAAIRDRQNNSGPGAPQGQDWDFGWDLILNLSQSATPQALGPHGHYPLPPQADGSSARGFAFTDLKHWQQTLGQMEKGRLYLASLSRPSNHPRYQILHHHVAALLADKKHVWFYQATAERGSHRIDLKTDTGLKSLIERFSPPQGQTSHILVVRTPWSVQ